MRDLIDRQAAIDALEDYMDSNTLDGYEDSRTLIEILKELPSAQPEITYCKDCKWSDWYTAVDGKRYHHCLETGAAGRTEDDYCSYAEREEGEQNAD